MGRETVGCPACGSTLRLRGLVALISQEILGVQMALSDFPDLKGLRGFGMSDPPNLASQLEKKFDYTNTFYHQAPTIDITNPEESEWGRYDFIISSEVMEHVPPPVEKGFANLHRLLKPNGVLLLTIPYGIDMQPREHYPHLHEYALASPGGKTVLVNRRRDGSTEVFEDLCFHGGDGSTLEMRVFNEVALRATILRAGFDAVHIATENVPEFGVENAEAWSLPIVARKGKLQPSVAELARSYRARVARQTELAAELASIQSEYQRHIAFHEQSHQESERLLAQRAEWVKKIEQQFEERTQWALSLDKDYKELLANIEQYKREAEAEADRRWEDRKWTRLGRKLGAL
ncbi:MAG: methyltransferase domain-containing protein [Acidobacteriota bacterium]